jgi:hypothetical protein
MGKTTTAGKARFRRFCEAEEWRRPSKADLLELVDFEPGAFGKL